MVGCNDYPMIWKKHATDAERLAQLEHAIRTYPHDAFKPFTPREIAYSDYLAYNECLAWPKPTSNYEPPISPGEKPTKAPVLVVSGELDDTTTAHEGHLVKRGVPRRPPVRRPQRRPRRLPLRRLLAGGAARSARSSAGTSAASHAASCQTPSR